MSTSGSTGQAPGCCARSLEQIIPEWPRLCLGFPCIPSWRTQVQMAACLSGLVCRNQVQPGRGGWGEVLVAAAANGHAARPALQAYSPPAHLMMGNQSAVVRPPEGDGKHPRP